MNWKTYLKKKGARVGAIVVAVVLVLALIAGALGGRAGFLTNLDGAILGKPRDHDDAVRMLTALSGREHIVYTGVAVLRGGELRQAAEQTAVRFRALTPAEIERYIATGEPMDKAGAYGIQGRGALFVAHLDGDYFNVMGLPLCRLGQLLNELGVELL